MKFQNPLIYLKHVTKDPVKSIAEIKERKKRSCQC